MTLKDYNKKRDFKATSEPKGEKIKSGKKLRFVVQRHAASRLHYDFRLEMDGVLKSWAVPKGPSLNPSDRRLAVRVEDHPFSYRTFEGSIPEGNYGAGEVEIWDQGTYEPLEQAKDKSDDLVMRAELHQQSLKFILHGKKLKGEFALFKIKSSEEENAWLLVKHKDQYALSESYNAEEHTAKDSKVTAFLKEKNPKKKTPRENKIAQNNNTDAAEKGKGSTFIKPMLCKSSDFPFEDPEWAFEIKWDGYRAIAELRDGDCRLYSRNGIDYSQKFLKITHALKSQKQQMILDGEIVAFDQKGKPDFQSLQRFGENSGQALVYQVFDLLWLNGHSTEELTYLERKELLKEALQENETIKYQDYVIGNGISFFQSAKQMGIEGIIAKKSNSRYKENQRSSEWIKIKANKSDEAIVCGFTEPQGERIHFGSLILGKLLGGEMVFCGQVGTGFKNRDLMEIYQKMEPLIVPKSVFKVLPKTNAKATWIFPHLVAEITYTELTKDYIYRHPVFLRLREDVSPDQVTFELQNSASQKTTMDKKKTKDRTEKADDLKKIGGQEVKLTNQNKIYFPKEEITKGDVINYYQRIATYILPYLKDRAESMNRFPNGIHEPNFFQKDAPESIPDWIQTEKVFSESTGKYVDYIVCNNKETLAYLNNLGCIELNVWTSRIKKPDRPDYLVLDLDPSEKNTFDEVIETALCIKEVLNRAGILGIPKTSGGTGIHVYIPMGAKYSYEQVKNFGHLLMQNVHQLLPGLTTLERSLQKRAKDKIYLDYLQNNKGQTLASVYSLRPREGAPVSMPLRWEELKPGLQPTDFTIFNALERLQKKGDLFKPVLGKGIDMLKILNTLEKNL